MTIFPNLELCVSIVCQFYGHSRKPLLGADIIFVQEKEVATKKDKRSIIEKFSF